MIEAGLEFENAIDRVTSAFAELPLPVRPIHFSHEEKLDSDRDLIGDKTRFAEFVAKSESGFFLLGPAVTYSIRIASGKSLVCDCFMEVSPELAKQFLECMSKARPVFGFACAPAERERRNRITTRQGANTIDGWVGRDTRKYVPGFYWLTLLSDALAIQHGVPISSVEAIAEEHIQLEGGLHLFRFYGRPEDWGAMSTVANLSASLPGVFNVEKVKPSVLAAKNFLELSSILREWK